MANRILVASSDGITALDIEEILAANGYQVTTAVPIAPGSVIQTSRKAPDLLLLDIAGDLHSGTELAREMLQMFQVPLILLTALWNGESRPHVESAGPIGYLRKPFREYDLLRLVRKYLAGP